MGLNPFKKKDPNETEDLSMVSEYKEPFTWSNFWEDQVVTRFKAMQAYLRERGVLSLITSPFRYRTRLIIIISIVIIGVFSGIIPRSMSMVHTLRDSFTKSEISQMDSSDTSGPMTVVPLISGQVNNQHVIVFNLTGPTATGIPSVTSGFKVSMKSEIGANPQKIKYSYKVLPMDDSNRLLVLYIDDRQQGGNHKSKVDLNIQIKGMPGMASPLTLIMSGQQAKSPIFDGQNINLSALSSPLTNQEASSQGSSIKSAQAALKSQLNTYQLNYQRLYAMKVYVKMTPTQLNQLVQKQISMPTLTDSSTTQVLSGLDPNHPSAGQAPPILSTELLYNSKIYKTSSSSATSGADASDTSDDSAQIGDGNDTAQTEVKNLNTIFNNINQAVATLNQTRLSKYQSLTGVQQTLNQKLTVNDFNKNMQSVDD